MNWTWDLGLGEKKTTVEAAFDCPPFSPTGTGVNELLYNEVCCVRVGWLKSNTMSRG